MPCPVVERDDMECAALSDRDLTVRIVGAVAEAVDTDPVELPPLYQVVDPEAIETVLVTADDACVQFEYAGQAVEIRSDGTVTVDEEGPRG